MHTPAPWKAVTHSRHTTIEATPLVEICEMTPWAAATKEQQQGWDDEQSDNARLLAAAPELLEALRDLLMDAESDREVTQASINKARAAIKKATCK